MFNDNNNTIAGPINTQTNGSRSVFARLMSTENISVVFDPKSKEAWFDTNTRTLNMPNWTGMTPEVYDLLLSHEVSHALHTPKEQWIGLTEELAGEKASEPNKQVARQYINIVEDARIERLIKAKYPGLARDYYKGYKWLMDAKMCGDVDKMDLNEMAFIDRINIHFKLGVHAGLAVPFSPDEQAIVDMIGEADSFDDVAKAARLVWDHATSEDQQPKKKSGAGAGQGNGKNGDGESDGSGESEGDGDADGEGNTLGQKPKRSLSHIAPKTCKFQEQFLRDHLHKEDSWNRPPVDAPYILPEFDLSQIIIPHQKIYTQLNEALESCPNCVPWRSAARNEYSEFISEADATIDAMVKTFMLKKAASAHHRQQQSKTGTLDMNLLSTYKWNEDLFKHFTIKPNGKNHGFILLLDWSGSMAGVILGVVKQMYILTSFFRKIGVPYEVYAFSSNMPCEKYYSDYYEYRRSLGDTDGEWEELNKIRETFITNAGPNTLESTPFFLYQFASNTMNKAQHTKAMESLFMLALSFTGTHSTANHHSPQMPYWLSLSDTPLDHSMIAMVQILPEFRRKHRIEIMNLVVITDGSTSGSPIDNWQSSGKRCTRIVNPKTGASFPLVNQHTTNLLAEYINDATGVNTIMLYLDIAMSGTNVRIPGYETRTVRGINHNQPEEQSALNSQWSKENFLLGSPKTHGYSEYGVKPMGFRQVYAIRILRKADTTEAAFEEMDSSNTAYSRLKNQFVKSLKSRIVSRSLVNRMVEGMAKHI